MPVGNLLLLHHAGDAQAAPPRFRHGLGTQYAPHLRAADRQGVDLPRPACGARLHLVLQRAPGTSGHIFHIGAGNLRALLLPGRGRRELHKVDRRARTVGIARHQCRVCLGKLVTGALGGVFSHQRQFLPFQGAEKNLHAARAQGWRQVGRAARGRAHESEIGGQAVFEDIVDIGGRPGICWVVIGAVKAHQAVFEHLEQLVHLHRVHLADFVQEQYAAMRACDRAFLGLGHAVLSQRARALVNGIMHAAKQRVGNGTLVKAHAGGVHLYKRRVLAEGRAFRALGRL